MTSPPAKPRKAASARQQSRTTSDEIVDPRWLLKALGLVVLGALLCGYATFCLLFFQGQWQLVLHPSRSAEIPAQIDGIRPELVRFGADPSGLPQRTGWWIPAGPGSRFEHLVVLFLPREDSSLAGSVPTLTALHQAGVSIFGTDFRGYGQSAAIHPSEVRMNEDAEAAVAYLRDARHLPADDLIPFGQGVSGSIAARLATSHPQMPAIILEEPEPDVADRVRHDRRVRLLPVGLLLRERFPLMPQLAHLHTPKLILTRSTQEDAAIQATVDPKITAVVPAGGGDAVGALLRRFFDQYAPPSAAPRLLPGPVPTSAKARGE